MLLVHKTNNIIFLLIIIAIAIPSVSAVIYSETTLSTSISNTTLVVTGEVINADEVTIYNDSILLENLTTYTAYGTANSYRINLTGNNNTTQSYKLPKVNTSTGVTNQIATITNGLGSNTNTTVSVYTSNLPVSPVLQHSNYSENVSGVYDPGAGTFTFTATITPGDNILYLNGATIDGVAAAPICNQARDSISTFATWLNVLAIVLALGIILYVTYGITTGTLNIDTGLIIKAGAGLIIAGLFITIGYIIVSAAASTCV